MDFDRYVLAPVMAAFGESVTYYNTTLAPQVLRAVYDDRYRETTFKDGLEVVDTHPVLGLRTADLPAGVLPVKGEGFRVQGRLYVVSDPPETDGHGHIKVPLRFANDTEARKLAVPPP